MYEEQREQQKLGTLNKLKNFALFTWDHAWSLQFLYLSIFSASNILDVVWSANINLLGVMYTVIVPIVLAGAAFILKMVLVVRKITLKEFYHMQIDFISPYTLTIINVVLVAQLGKTLNSNSDTSVSKGPYFIIQGLSYLVVTMVCSLIMNRKTTSKMQFYVILLNIIFQAAGGLILTILYIQNLNEISDQLHSLNQSNLVITINNTFSTDPNSNFQQYLQEYNQDYEEISEILSTYQITKDYAIASLASIIAVLIILMDVIRRPFEKIQHHEEIIEGLIQDCKMAGEVKRTKENKVTIQFLENKKYTPLVPPNSYKKLEMNMSEQSSTA